MMMMVVVVVVVEGAATAADDDDDDIVDEWVQSINIKKKIPPSAPTRHSTYAHTRADLHRQTDT